MNNNTNHEDMVAFIDTMNENLNELEDSINRNEQNGGSIINYTFNTDQSDIKKEEDNNNTNSKFTSNLIKIIKLNKFLCNKCKKIPILTFLKNNFNKLEYSCDCVNNKEISYENLIKNFFLVQNANKTIESQLEENNSYNIEDYLDYLSYCQNCNVLIKNKNLHITHKIFELNDYRNFINNEFELNEDENNNYIIKKVNFYDNFAKLINFLFQNLIIYLDLNNFENIKNSEKIRENINNIENIKI